MPATAARHSHWTEAEYTAMENESVLKHEYLAGEVFAMSGAKPAHNLITSEVIAELVLLTRKGSCRSFDSNQRIHVPATGLYTYADAGAYCGEMKIHSDEMCLLNPVLLVEVLSPSTRKYDLGAKREHYQKIPSLRHLLLFDQPARRVWHYSRRGRGAWESAEHTGGRIEIAALGGSIDVDAVYRD